MNIFSIRDIENLTGIKAHTLRIWEKRYGIIIPPTAPGKHRIYDNNDLKHILRISSLYHKGLKISRIAEMSIEEIQKNTLSADPRSNFEAFINNLLEYTVENNETDFKRLMSELRETMGDINMYLHVVFPFLSRIGEFWLNDKIAPVQEHFCSNLIRNELILSIDRVHLNRNQKRTKVILFSPKNEHHEIPLLFCNLMLKSRNIDTLYLGVDTHESVLSSVVNKTKPDWLLSYLITNFTDADINEYVKNISHSFSQHNIILAGPGFKNAVAVNEKVRITRSMNELVNFCLSL
jgi:DNA-binding transcriptional MerR regulator